MENSEVVDYAELLKERFSEVTPHTFYRELFPEGSLSPSFPCPKGQYAGMAIRIKADGANERRPVLDDLQTIEWLRLSDDFCVLSPLSYAGKTQRKRFAHALYAVVIDLDGLKVKDGQPKGLEAVLAMAGKEGGIPQPSHIVASGTGLHLYYMLAEPFLMFPDAADELADMRRTLTRMIWNPQVTDLCKNIQYEGVVQGFRMVGTMTKVGTRVRAFRTGERVSMDYLRSFTDGLHLVKPRMRRETVPLSEAKEKWPEWYEKRVVQGVPRKAWRCKRDLYEWWKARMKDEGSYGHRYWCMLALGTYAKKCGIPRDELERDAEALRVELNKKPAADELTKKQVAEALTACRAGMVTYPIDEIIDKTGIEFEKNKRNGLKQEQHLYLARRRKEDMKAIGLPMKNPEGRPKGSGTKADLIRAYAAEHPDASHAAIAKALGVSRTTVIKWLKPAADDDHAEVATEE